MVYLRMAAPSLISNTSDTVHRRNRLSSLSSSVNAALNLAYGDHILDKWPDRLRSDQRMSPPPRGPTERLVADGYSLSLDRALFPLELGRGN